MGHQMGANPPDVTRALGQVQNRSERVNHKVEEKWGDRVSLSDPLASQEIVEMQMNIDCDGCEDNVRKALLRLQGVHYVDVDRARDKVTVTGTASQKKVLRAARRTGKLAVLWPSAYDPGYHHAYAYAHAQPAYYSYQAKPAAAHAHRNYNSVPHGKSGYMPAAQYGSASSYNYHVHGYYDSDLHGYYHQQQGLSNAAVPVDAGSYFSDDNPSACSVM
uniref:HMA domain-containing protein n=1 Tax=Aegilops tauschii TaxID=37682 RepID=M8BV22_AEGTA